MDRNSEHFTVLFTHSLQKQFQHWHEDRRNQRSQPTHCCCIYTSIKSLLYGHRHLTLLPHGNNQVWAGVYSVVSRICKTEAWREIRESDCSAFFFYVWNFSPSVFFLFVSVVSSPSLLLCLFSLMPMVAKVTGINSYSQWFSAVLITIYLCKSQCVCAKSLLRLHYLCVSDCLCVCFCQPSLVSGLTFCIFSSWFFSLSKIV